MTVAIVSDLDGTLLRSDGVLSPATLAMLDTLRTGRRPMLVATARTPRGLRKVDGYRHLGRVVCANGAVVWDAGRDEVLRQIAFDPSALLAGTGALRRALPDAGLALLSVGTMFADDAFIALRATGWHGAVALSDVDQVVSAHDIVVVAVRHAGLTADQLLGPVALAFAGAGLASFAGVGVVDVSPPGVTKAAAVAEEVGCDAGDVIAFGDMPNDLPLFEWSGWACAVANAHPSVLAAADEIVPSNDDDGVARTVERLLR